MIRDAGTKEVSRKGFTLVELLIVITILVILATLVAMTFSGNSTDKMRSGARVAQSAFLGAKDRALHAREQRGIRLIRDSTNPSLFMGFIYLQPLSNQSFGNIPGQSSESDFSIGRDANGDATLVKIGAPRAATLFGQDQNGIWAQGGVRMRIPSSTGQWYYLMQNQTSPPYWGTMTAGVLNLTLQTGFNGGKPPNLVTGNTNAIDFGDANASCDLYIGNELLPYHQPINLPSGVVIDLAYCSQNVKNLAASNTAVDLMFSPRGGISGYIAALGPLHFCLRDLADATAGLPPTSPNVKGDCLILSIFPQTGLVQTFPADLVSGNLFSFAQAGSSAGG